MQKPKTTQQRSNQYSDEYIAHLKDCFMMIAKEFTPNFVIDDRNREIVANLFNYFLGLDGRYDLSKGLWLMGDVGTGKSSLMYIFSTFMQKMLRNGFKVHICAKVSNDYSVNGDLDAYTYNLSGYSGVPVPMCFDELGRETIPANYFGQKLNVMQHILHIRYSIWQTSKVKTYITTNCDTELVHELYDGSSDRFISDRCREMFNVIAMTGSSRRK